MYQWIKDYQQLQQDMDYLEYQIARNKKELKRWTSGDLQNVKLNDKSVAANLENTIFELEYELAHKMNDLYDAKKLISSFKGIDHQILYQKYVEDRTLESIAEQLNYSAGYIYKKHAEIMRVLKFAHDLNLTFSSSK
ncbi:hypothetical protein [Ornithinibacillus bavariensis]|nr:hypothetical protein [Ornithinibacillus bavariensis]HAM79627.1 hypothetical protein [Ornithinibacillus sp.]